MRISGPGPGDGQPPQRGHLGHAGLMEGVGVVGDPRVTGPDVEPARDPQSRGAEDRQEVRPRPEPEALGQVR
ncbi:MAG TPA: hypothetical protein VGP70_02735, partial [Actinomadura sp.]|nr:hypothetical protein [Actinomadura sp.]